MAASDVTGLDTVIKKVDAGGNARHGVHFISIKGTSGELDAPFWKIGGGPTHVYRVCTEVAGEPAALSESSTIHVKDPGSDDLVNLTITYQAICPEGNERRLVQSLGRNGEPDSALRALITGEARTFLWGAGQAFFDDYAKTQSQLLAKITSAVESKTGLRFQATVRLELENQLSPVHIDEYFEMRFCDSPEPRRVRLQADLDVEPNLALRAIIALRRADTLRPRIVEAAKYHARHKIPAQAFVEQFRIGPHTNELAQAVQKVASDDGRKVSGITLTAQGREHLPPPEIELMLDQQIRALGRDTPITLVTKLLLSLENLAIYQASQISNVEKWANAAFEAVVKVACFEKRYRDYLQTASWAEIESSIKELMLQRVKSIGYQIKQILSSPQLGENEFRELRPHRFEVGMLPLRSTARARVDLTIDATFAIANWDNEVLLRKVDQGVNLSNDIRQEIYNSLTDVLVETTPNDFYLCFAERRGGAESIEMKLADSVAEKLKSVYGANIVNVVVTQVDTEEVKKVRALLQEPHDASFGAKPLGLGEEVHFTTTWRVADLDKDAWDIITRSFCNEKEISKAVIEALAGRFATLSDTDLRFETYDERKFLQEQADDAIRTEVNSIFGLTVSTSNLRRYKTALENKIDDVRIGKIKTQLDQQLKELEHLEQIQQLERDQEKQKVLERGKLTEIEHKRLTDLLAIPSVDLNAEQRDQLDDLTRRSDQRLPSSGRKLATHDEIGGLEDIDDKARIMGEKIARPSLTREDQRKFSQTGSYGIQVAGKLGKSISDEDVIYDTTGETLNNRDIVECRAFAPPIVSAGERFQLQVHLHLREALALVLREVTRIDPNANLLGREVLTRIIPRGGRVDVFVACPALIVDRPGRSVEWSGNIASLIYDIEVPNDLDRSHIECTIFLSMDGIPVGELVVKLRIGIGERRGIRSQRGNVGEINSPNHDHAACAARIYKTAFVSYARKDFQAVSLFAEALARCDIKLSMDVTSLEPGDEWAERLLELVGDSDVFYLMWSDSAAISEWVETEVREAVTCHYNTNPSRPSIVPITLHRPAPEPPESLRKFHFDSTWIALRSASITPLFRQ